MLEYISLALVQFATDFAFWFNFPTRSFYVTGNARNCSSPEAVEKVRHQIIEKMDLWLSECHANGRSSM